MSGESLIVSILRGSLDSDFLAVPFFASLFPPFFFFWLLILLFSSLKSFRRSDTLTEVKLSVRYDCNWVFLDLASFERTIPNESSSSQTVSSLSFFVMSQS